jgi:hypothetical protein
LSQSGHPAEKPDPRVISPEQAPKPSTIEFDKDNSQSGFASPVHDPTMGVLGGEVDLDKILSAEEDIGANFRKSASKSSSSGRFPKAPRRTSSRRRVDDYMDARAKTSKGREKALQILGTSTEKEEGSQSSAKKKSNGGSRSKSNGRSQSRSHSRSQSRSHSRSRRSMDKPDRSERTESKRQERLMSASRSSLHVDNASVGGRSKNSKSSKQSKGDADSERRKMSKMEKIEQLQAKNALYKEEYKRVQKDKKHLKKEIETKKLEVSSLSQEIDTYISATTMLKSQLSEALQQLDRNDDGGEGVEEMAMELSRTRAELDVAVKRVSDVKAQIESLQTEMTQKENMVELLTEDVAGQAMRLRELEMENEHLVANANDNDRLPEMQYENERLQEELSTTLERASAMVKEREDAIADLLKENDEIKDILAEKESGPSEQENEEFIGLGEEINAANAALEETQDRNVVLEEEVENWIQRGGEMGKEVARLQDELDVLERRATTAEQNLEAAKEANERLSKDLEKAHDALAEAEERHQERVAEMAAKHKAALLDMKTRHAEERTKEAMEQAEGVQKTSTVDQQSMLLKAVANRKPEDPKKGWFAFTKTESDDEMDEDQKRFKGLEMKNAAQEEEIKKLKSELVRSRSTYNEQIYVSKKQIERLDQENQAYASKILSLEKSLERAHTGGA